MTILDTLQTRDCPVCGRAEHDAEPFLASSVDGARLGPFSFASRKSPEYMSFRLVRCTGCETVFAAEAPPAEALAQAYESADYDTAEEAIYAARTYSERLGPKLDPANLAGSALEIGTGTGIFLGELKRLGFHDTIGVEPSTAAIAAADPAVRDTIRLGVFRQDDFGAETLSLICCFQTLEHVPDPVSLAKAAFALLRPGGQIAFITHDYTAPLNRWLGRRSPIIDVEHMQLFCPQSLRALLTSSGFQSVDVATIRNRYPVRYWMRLIPLPKRLKALCHRIAERLGVAGLPISLDVGNLLTIARKPAAALAP